MITYVCVCVCPCVYRPWVTLLEGLLVEYSNPANFHYIGTIMWSRCLIYSEYLGSHIASADSHHFNVDCATSKAEAVEASVSPASTRQPASRRLLLWASDKRKSSTAGKLSDLVFANKFNVEWCACRYLAYYQQFGILSVYQHTIS